MTSVFTFWVSVGSKKIMEEDQYFPTLWTPKIIY